MVFASNIDPEQFEVALQKDEGFEPYIYGYKHI